MLLVFDIVFGVHYDYMVDGVVDQIIVLYFLEWGMLGCWGAHSNMFFSGWNWEIFNKHL